VRGMWGDGSGAVARWSEAAAVDGTMPTTPARLDADLAGIVKLGRWCV